MKKFFVAVVIVLISAASANAQDAQKAWAKFFAGSWNITGGDTEGEMNLRLAAKGTAAIGTGKDTKGHESAWIMGWDGVSKRAIHAWFGDEGDHGRAVYEIVDKNTLRGPGVSRSAAGVMKGTVTLKRTGENRYTVHWTEVTSDGTKTDDLNLVAERK